MAKYVSLDNLSKYDELIKEYADDNYVENPQEIKVLEQTITSYDNSNITDSLGNVYSTSGWDITGGGYFNILCTTVTQNVPIRLVITNGDESVTYFNKTIDKFSVNDYIFRSSSDYSGNFPSISTAGNYKIFIYSQVNLLVTKGDIQEFMSAPFDLKFTYGVTYDSTKPIILEGRKRGWHTFNTNSFYVKFSPTKTVGLLNSQISGFILLKDFDLAKDDEYILLHIELINGNKPSFKLYTKDGLHSKSINCDPSTYSSNSYFSTFLDGIFLQNFGNVHVYANLTIGSGKTIAYSSNRTDLTNYELVHKQYVDSIIPQKSTMPTASSNNEGVIYQFTGTTDSTYSNGYFYKCVSDGQSTPTYSWQRINVQPSSGGGGSTDVQINGTSIVSDDTANIITNSAYDSSTNKIATMNDVDTKSAIGLLNTSNYSSSNPLVLENLKPGIYYVENNTTANFYIKALNSVTGSNSISNSSSSTLYTIILTQTPSSSTSDGTVLGEILTNQISFAAGNGNISNNTIRMVYNTGYSGNVNLYTREYSAGSIVSTTGVQTVSGRKTFSTLPESSVAPTSSNQLTNKNYVDGKITYGTTDLGPSDTLADGAIYVVYED